MVCRIQNRQVWWHTHVVEDFMVWGRDAWCYVYLELWMPIQSDWSRSMPLFKEVCLDFVAIFKAYHRCNTHRRSRNYWLFLACHSIWWYVVRVINWWGCLFRYRYLLLTWDIVWISMLWPFLWRLLVLFWCWLL